MRISTRDEKPQGEWCSLNEFMGKGDGKKVAFQTPFPAKEARGLHVMRGNIIVPVGNLRRVLDPDGKLLRDEPDGYTISVIDSDQPVTVTFDQPVPVGVRVSCSAIGRQPEKGEALRVLPLTDSLAKGLDEKMPAELRRRKREDVVTLPAVQDWNREAYLRLVVDCHGFLDENGTELAWDPKVQKAILNTLGSLMLGSFAFERANTLMEEQKSGREAELVD